MGVFTPWELAYTINQGCFSEAILIQGSTGFCLSCPPQGNCSQGSLSFYPFYIVEPLFLGLQALLKPPWGLEKQVPSLFPSEGLIPFC